MPSWPDWRRRGNTARSAPPIAVRLGLRVIGGRAKIRWRTYGRRYAAGSKLNPTAWVESSSCDYRVKCPVSFLTINCGPFNAGSESGATPRQEHWVIADLVGKGGHVRTVPMPGWVKDAIDAWTATAGITGGTVFRAISKVGWVWGNGMTAKVLWDVVRHAAAAADIAKLAPHDLRRTCARLCHLAGGELDQIQFLLGHVSIQTTERYLGCKQKLRHAVNDRLGIEPDAT